MIWVLTSFAYKKQKLQVSDNMFTDSVIVMIMLHEMMNVDCVYCHDCDDPLTPLALSAPSAPPVRGHLPR